MNVEKLYLTGRSFAERIEKSDEHGLRRLRHALTVHLPISNYAKFPESEIKSALHLVDVALEVFKKPEKRTRNRIKKPPRSLNLMCESADLFYDLNRWPRKPYCSNDLQYGLRIRSLFHAVKMTHIQFNPPNRKTWIVFDIDRPGAENAWREAGLAEPTWTAINQKNGHAHIAYGLRSPVMVGGLGVRDAPMRFLASIEAMMREKLKADIGYSGLITKNPAHDSWEILRGSQAVFDLSELAASLPGIEKYRLKKKEEQAGIGRNLSLFNKLRKWAYVAIRPYWKSGGLGSWNSWVSLCNSKALVLNSEFTSQLNGTEVWHLARSVARYTWKFTTEEGFSAWQAAQGQKGGKASGHTRRAASEDKRASARLMRSSGLSIRAIAKALSVGVMTAHDWCA